MKKIVLLSLLITAFCIEQVEAQRGMRRNGRFQNVKQARKNRQQAEKFQPTVDLSFGYAFPNLDKNNFVDFSGLYKGDYLQTGPVTGSIDYHFTRNMSIGVLVTHGKTSVPYYDYSNTNALNANLESWSFMLNVIRHIPVSGSKVIPYTRTAIGVNTWKQDYTDISGTKLNYISKPTELVYQAGIGARFSLSKGAGFFIEAGYGKYILQGGLSFKF